MGGAVLQYGHCSSDTARRRWAGRMGAGLGVQERRRAQGASGAQAGRAGRAGAGHAGKAQARWALRQRA